MATMLSLIAALARNRTVGIENRLPWHLSEDLKYFKATTSGHPIIMGRKTYDSIGRPLPGRHNIVVTRNPAWRVDGVTITHSIKDAIAAADPTQEVFLIGGASLYAEALPLADRLYLTEIEADVEGDAFFPTWSREQFKEVRRERHQSDAFAYSFVMYERISA
ncbi:dihydrofolate reductase [Chitinimonas sp. BJB300]|uniref:dihydrofolate reductase n=1 Tax=Chitinimonas sp. BJB300 TaxID=1559339 RepID=UPI000C0ED45F|nr:dihydrofolate reductase [Chitinimonas sp. BJB300]PHV11962.1 diacylglycerol kinase [Chitinimonas sp. BJB300]TSJ87274.1 dihydrofolate reductase [Chitinimonas sp. BJB300]